MKTTVITLGEQKFTVGMLPIGVLRELDAEMSEAPPSDDPRKTEEFHFDRAVKCISIAMSTIDPKWTILAVSELPINDIQEIFDAHRAILFHSGLVKLKDVNSGEGRAAA